LRDETKLLSLFDEKTLKPQKVFTYEGGEDVRVEYVFKNSREAGPGVPLPAGVVKIFSSGTEEGMLAFIGEDRIKHIPVDEEVRVSTGNAFDLRGERREMERVRISKNEYRESYEIELRNRKSEDVEIVVVEHPSGDWKITSSSLPYVKKSKDRIEFKVRVPKGDTVILSYSLETRW
jgi:hypothetical protein